MQLERRLLFVDHDTFHIEAKANSLGHLRRISRQVSARSRLSRPEGDFFQGLKVTTMTESGAHFYLRGCVKLAPVTRASQEARYQKDFSPLAVFYNDIEVRDSYNSRVVIWFFFME